MDTTDENWLRLCLNRELGYRNTLKLLAAFGDAGQVLAASTVQHRALIGEAGAEALRKGADSALLTQTLQWLDQPDHFIVALDAEDFPELLLKTGYPPPLLYGVGRRELLVHPKLAIVGSRNPSVQGERNARSFAQALAAEGYCIVSGLAKGIDACAHVGGMEAEGSTIAVVGTGLDRVYPASNRALAQRIAREGLILSEFALGTPPVANNFPRRNRIISGLAAGCLVVEAAHSSGSLITARLAIEQDREVFAIPGSIHSPLSKGCHALIKQGAKLVEKASDILEELKWLGAAPPAQVQGDAAHDPADELDSLLQAMGYDALDLDSLCARTGLSVDRLSAQLLRWELDGKVAVLPGNLYQRVF